jgi:hypothetical protein
MERRERDELVFVPHASKLPLELGDFGIGELALPVE